MNDSYKIALWEWFFMTLLKLESVTYILCHPVYLALWVTQNICLFVSPFMFEFWCYAVYLTFCVTCYFSHFVSAYIFHFICQTVYFLSPNNAFYYLYLEVFHPINETNIGMSFTFQTDWKTLLMFLLFMDLWENMRTFYLKLHNHQ